MNNPHSKDKPEAQPALAASAGSSSLSVDDALEGWGNPSDRAHVLALEVEKLRARLDECHKFRAVLIRNIANRETPNDQRSATPHHDMNNPHSKDKPEAQPALAASAGSSFRELADNETIQAGDEFIPFGCIDSWMPVWDSIGRTVGDQLARRNTNQAERFRRARTPNDLAEP